MPNVTVKGGSIESVIKDAFKITDTVVNESALACAQTVARRAQRMLKAAPIGGSGKYNRGWRVKKEKDGAIVYNASQPSLTHLLENGHDVISHGVKVGRARAIPHIKPVEEETKVFFEEIVIDEIERRLGQ